MRKIFAITLLFISMNALAQNTRYDISKDPKNGELTFKGPVSFDELNREPSFAWLRAGAEEYRPDERLVNILKERLPKYSIVIFLGTWCEDSHYLVPKLEKVLQLTGYPMSQVTMYGVDREKKTKDEEEKKYNVTLVPTIILFKDGKEAGRITEAAEKSIEADLATITRQ